MLIGPVKVLTPVMKVVPAVVLPDLVRPVAVPLSWITELMVSVPAALL